MYALPSKLLNDSNSSIRAEVLSCSWYLVATWTQICRFCRILWVSMARRHSRESSTDREPKQFTSHYKNKQAHILVYIYKQEKESELQYFQDRMQYLRIEEMSVDNGSLDVKNVRVVLQGLQKMTKYSTLIKDLFNLKLVSK